MNADVAIEQAGADDAAARAFLAKVGERVRVARSRKRVSRKALSDVSGVSQRYLAQLEGGGGNISIGLLRRVADALGSPIEWFVGEDEPLAPELIQALRAAGPERRARALEILNGEAAAPGRARRIALIGLRGAGKSTLGRLAARETALPFLELNARIAEESGIPVNEVIALYGQEGYRRLERQAIEHIAETTDAIVLAVAGGIVSEPETFAYLLTHYHTIWLRARPEEHMARVRAQGDTRPMAGNPAAMDELKAILKDREALYARAEIQVDTSGRTLDQSLGELLAAMRGNGLAG